MEKNIRSISATTQTNINAFINYLREKGDDLTGLAYLLTPLQLVRYIETIPKSTTETQIAVRSLSKSLVGVLFELGKVEVSHYQTIKDTVRSVYGWASNDLSSLRYWNLIEPTDFDQQTGYWRITENGKKFLQGELSVSKKVKVHNGNVIHRSEEQVSIKDFDVLEWQSFKPKNHKAIGNYDYGKVVDIMLGK